MMGPIAPAFAQEGEGRRLSELAFQSLDRAQRGFVDQGEFVSFGSDVFFSIDNDADGAMTLAEFMDWGFGMEQVAEAADRTNAYETALRVVFAFWDLNGDGSISQTEHRQSLMTDFRRADFDHDALLTEEEFLHGFSLLIAVRAAIDPTPVE
ncbi:hypothetical protein [Jannaschia sp. CCS1]|uniref:hypothetical protein n=1 Tax=Jannaschia sp. (strain CCS1) TaxID=290400 RepID=UPI0002F29B17|nr:hypothetical protein [Jannaschia sp. CCS1]